MDYMTIEYLKKIFRDANATPGERAMILNLNKILIGEDDHGIRLACSHSDRIAAATALLQSLPALERRAEESAKSDLAFIIKSFNGDLMMEERLLELLRNPAYGRVDRENMRKALAFAIKKQKINVSVAFSSMVELYETMINLMEDEEVFEEVFGHDDGETYPITHEAKHFLKEMEAAEKERQRNTAVEEEG